MADLRDKTGLLISSDAAFGQGIVKGLAEAGALIYLATPDPQEAHQAAVLAVEALGGRALPLSVDPADGEALLELFRRIEAESGRLDLLVNGAEQAAGAQQSSEAFWESPLSRWDEDCGTFLRNRYRTSALAARLMVQQGDGLIVNLADSRSGSRRGLPAEVCRAGMTRMTARMAVELAEHDVTAVSLAFTSDREQPLEARFLGRCLAALAMDPDVAEKNGMCLEIEALRREYRFSELKEEPT